MSSTGQIVGGIVGAVYGYVTGDIAGALQYASYGVTVGGILDPPKQPATHMFGARLGDLTQQTSSYGTPICRIYGSSAVYGNIFWIENNKLKEVVTVTESDGGKGGGGGGSTSTTYAYFATFAVGLCEGPITGIRRIWIGSELFYDAGSGDLEAILASNKKQSTFTLYKGTEDQMPNSRIEAEHGADTSAYRGLAYIVFYDLALRNFGNSVRNAQVKVEVITGSETPSTVTLPTKYWDSKVSDVSFIGECTHIDADSCTIVAPNWDSYYPGWSSVNIYRVYHNGTTIFKQVGCPGTELPPHYWSDTPEDFLYSSKQVFNTGGFDSFGNSGKCGKVNGLYYGITGTTTVWLYVNETSSPSTQKYTSLPSGYYGVVSDGEYIYVMGSSSSYPIRKYNKNLELIQTGTAYAPTILYNNRTHNLRFIDGTLYYFDANHSTLRLYSVREDLSGIDLLYNISTKPYHPIQPKWHLVGNTLIVVGTTHQVSNPPRAIQRYYVNLKTQTTSTVNLSDIVGTECEKSKYLKPSDIDVTSLNYQVFGYRVSNLTTLRSAISPLQGAFPFDIYQSGYKVKFKARGGSSIFSIDEQKMGPSIDAGNKEIVLTEIREVNSKLPKRIQISFLDKNREYDVGEQYAERISAPSNNILKMEMPITMDSTEASKIVDTLLYLYWSERKTFSFNLPNEYSYLEPTDIVTINTKDYTYELRLTDITYQPTGILECQARINKEGMYISSAVGEEGTSTGVSLQIGGQMYSVLLDLPCLTSDFNKSAVVLAGGGFSQNWRGGAIYRSDDQGTSWNIIQGINYSSTVATSNNIISSWPSTHIDFTSRLAVSMWSGSLSSVTFSQLLNGSNLFAYGVHGRWEIIQAMTCEIQSDGTYILSDLLRGRAGTEHNTNNHQIGDYLIYLNSGAYIYPVEQSIIGSTRYYKAVTFGDLISDSSSVPFTYQGNNLECLAPVYPNANRHPTTNDWTVSWIRRTRVSGEWRDNIDAPVSETTLAFDVEIYSNVSFTSIKRTLSNLTTNAFTYTNAQQVTDFGAVQTTLHIKVYQLSSIVGRGYPLTTSITR